MKQFSFLGIFHYYKGTDLIEDTIIPIIAASSLCILIYVTDNDISKQLDNLVSLGLDILPAMVALLFSAYAIVITFFADKVFQAIKDKENGKVLINSLNASFCLYLLVSVVGLFVMLATSIISGMKIEFTYAVGMNYFVYWILSFMLIYSVTSLFGIIMDIYYCGKATTNK